MSLFQPLQDPVSSGTPPSIRSIEEIIDLYRGEWVVMRVTDDDDGWPATGYVLTHAPRQQDALSALHALPADPRSSDKDRHPLYAFRAEPDMVPSPEYDAFRDQLLSDLTSPR